ncbi:MAG: protein phosphatase 2C domain-containing protein [Planctomycetaceae bacterium]|jgi:serine/threonine protein phosphatase PrpC|nr:protein phosphatase 2C domain-containing protein [Planctomycetaceae bacterium]
MDINNQSGSSIVLFYADVSSEAENVIKQKIATLTIPNGMVNVPYEWLADLTSSAGNSDLRTVDLVGDLKDIGLKAEIVAGKVKISGTPTKAFRGDKVLVRPLVRPCFDNYTKTVRFYIDPNPRSLESPNLSVADYEGYNNDTAENGVILSNTEKYDDGQPKVLGLAKGETVPAAPIEIDTPSAVPFEVIAASARGREHADKGEPRDDAFHFEFDKDTHWNFVAVADGGGSYRYSRKGSELASRTVIKKLRETLTEEFKLSGLSSWRDEFIKANGKLPIEKENEYVNKTQLGKVLYDAVIAAYQAIDEEHNKREGTVLKDYHTTLLCAAFRWFPELNNNHGGWFIASYWVGDGAAAVLRPTVSGGNFPPDKVFVLGIPDWGELPNTTRFLTQQGENEPEQIRSRCRFSFCDSFEAMIFMTDGVSDPFFPSDAAVVRDEQCWLMFYEERLRNGCKDGVEAKPCPEVFDAQLTPQAKSEALLKWLIDIYARANRDDRTILIVRNNTAK